MNETGSSGVSSSGLRRSDDAVGGGEDQQRWKLAQRARRWAARARPWKGIRRPYLPRYPPFRQSQYRALRGRDIEANTAVCSPLPRPGARLLLGCRRLHRHRRRHRTTRSLHPVSFRAVPARRCWRRWPGQALWATRSAGTGAPAALQPRPSINRQRPGGERRRSADNAAGATRRTRRPAVGTWKPRPAPAAASTPGRQPCRPGHRDPPDADLDPRSRRLYVGHDLRAPLAIQQPHRAVAASGRAGQRGHLDDDRSRQSPSIRPDEVLKRRPTRSASRKSISPRCPKLADFGIIVRAPAVMFRPARMTMPAVAMAGRQRLRQARADLLAQLRKAFTTRRRGAVGAGTAPRRPARRSSARRVQWPDRISSAASPGWLRLQPGSHRRNRAPGAGLFIVEHVAGMLSSAGFTRRGNRPLAIPITLIKPSVVAAAPRLSARPAFARDDAVGDRGTGRRALLLRLPDEVAVETFDMEGLRRLAEAAPAPALDRRPTALSMSTAATMTASAGAAPAGGGRRGNTTVS